MKGISVVIVSCIVISMIGYFGLAAINEHIDRESGAIVEQTLSDNTISQLQHISEVQSLINSGNISEASAKLSERAEALRYILSTNCNLEKCKDALKTYETE